MQLSSVVREGGSYRLTTEFTTGTQCSSWISSKVHMCMCFGKAIHLSVCLWTPLQNMKRSSAGEERGSHTQRQRWSRVEELDDTLQVRGRDRITIETAWTVQRSSRKGWNEVVQLSRSLIQTQISDYSWCLLSVLHDVQLQCSSFLHGFFAWPCGYSDGQLEPYGVKVIAGTGKLFVSQQIALTQLFMSSS